MSGGEDYIKRRMLGENEIAMPRELSKEVYDTLPPEVRAHGSYGIAEYFYNIVVETYQKRRA